MRHMIGFFWVLIPLIGFGTAPAFASSRPDFPSCALALTILELARGTEDLGRSSDWRHELSQFREEIIRDQIQNGMSGPKLEQLQQMQNITERRGNRKIVFQVHREIPLHGPETLLRLRQNIAGILTQTHANILESARDRWKKLRKWKCIQWFSIACSFLVMSALVETKAPELLRPYTVSLIVFAVISLATVRTIALTDNRLLKRDRTDLKNVEALNKITNWLMFHVANLSVAHSNKAFFYDEMAVMKLRLDTQALTNKIHSLATPSDNQLTFADELDRSAAWTTAVSQQAPIVISLALWRNDTQNPWKITLTVFR